MAAVLAPAGKQIRQTLTIKSVRSLDIRFPTSRTFDGSDAMNTEPDYSAAYAVIGTDAAFEGHGLTFTIGRGTDICCRVIEMLGDLIVGKSLRELTSDLAAFWYLMTSDSQIRWLGPEKGVVHLAAAAVINAVWDLYAKVEQKPLWKLLVDMSPEQIVATVPFRYITDAISPDEALSILIKLYKTRGEREAELISNGYPAYTTSAGWLGYSDEKIRNLIRQALSEGWTEFKMKVGQDQEADKRRAALIREEIGPDRTLMIDANQVWDVRQAIEWIKELAIFDPLWIEEPTSPDDILGHSEIRKAIAPIGIATGEHCHNRVMFKQFFQAGALDYCQIDACRLAGVNEVLAVILMAAKFGVPICPHAGGVGLCEYVQHLAIFDYVAISGSLQGRRIEYVDHLHEHFVDPVIVKNGRYMPPNASGYGVRLKPESLAYYSFPSGGAWQHE